MKKTISIGIALCICISLQGCAGFKGNKLSTINPSDLQVASNPNLKIYSNWTLETPSSLIDAKVKEKIAESHKKNFEDALKSAKCCILVNDAKEADLVLTARAIDENNTAAIIPAFITGLSLYTIPSWATSKTHIIAEARRADKNYTYDLQDQMTMVQWLPMIFAFPFANPFSMEKDMSINVNRVLISKLKADGALE